MKVSSKSNFENPPTGTHIARCVGLIGIGTHKQSWNGEEYFRDDVVIMWELPHEARSDGKPFLVNQTYTRSLGKKANLRHALVAWRGRDFTNDELKEFELKNILDKGCQIVLTRNDKDYVNVTAVAGVPKGSQLPDATYELVYYDVYEHDEDAFKQLSTYFQDKITGSYEYREQRDFGRILSDLERREVDRHGPQAVLDNGGITAAAAAPAPAPIPEDEIPF